MIIVDNLSKRFNGSLAVSSVSFAVQPGELLALLGPNGAGKTTTINCLLGFVAPDAGRLSIAGADVVADTRRARQNVAYIPEQVSLYGNFSAVENLHYFSELATHRYSATQLREFLLQTGLDRSVHDARISTYSKGMRQKVGIAIALAKQAKALLLDEPTSGLDPSASHEFSQLLRALRERGVAILMATHDLFRAKEDATQIGLMRRGQLARTLSAADFAHTDLEKLYVTTMTEQ
jgi:ABC-2 type transport system ATP-binding protein